MYYTAISDSQSHGDFIKGVKQQQLIRIWQRNHVLTNSAFSCIVLWDANDDTTRSLDNSTEYIPDPNTTASTMVYDMASAKKAVGQSEADNYNLNFVIGLTLAVSSSLFIGTSFIFKKKGLLKISVRAG